ncbi:hypothetical protein [uncultured Aquimarina sp.]|uniref:hypothetical protein n=1 Tax=uncultured Aquimarina sp. TaxID=575652 RepID=UPI002627A51C|nr:hypothetical protein [uncultured Aquimarina sp.]
MIKKTNLILVLYVTIFIFSCANDDEKPPIVEPDLGISQEIKDLIVFEGDENAPIVIVNAQSGADDELHRDDVEAIIQILGSTGFLAVNVHQAQTLNPSILDNNDITLDQAINFNTESIEMLYKVIKYFKDDGRTVYVFGSSFGGLVTQGLIAKKGIDVADKYLIVANRLDIDEVIWEGLSEGRFGFFENGINPVVSPTPDEDVIERNSARIIAGFTMYRYTQLFNVFEDLSKITYVYGKTDEIVGRLTASEIEFMESKQITIIEGNGDHDQTTSGDNIIPIFIDLFGTE